MFTVVPQVDRNQNIGELQTIWSNKLTKYLYMKYNCLTYYREVPEIFKTFMKIRALLHLYSWKFYFTKHPNFYSFWDTNISLNITNF